MKNINNRVTPNKTKPIGVNDLAKEDRLISIKK